MEDPDMDGPVYAAVDLGTHNCRMLTAVADREAGGFRVLDVFSRTVRLGEGLEASGQLGEAAMTRTVTALFECHKIMAKGAGAAARMNIDVITPAEEAKLTVRGCAGLIDPAANHVLLVDIGGGSTEVSWVACSEGRITGISTLSLPYGVVNLAERLGGGELAPSRYQKVAARVRDDVGKLDQTHGITEKLSGHRVQMIGTSGTMTTLGCVYLDLPEYDHDRVDGLDVPFTDITWLGTRLAAQDTDTRAANPCIGKARADLVAVGCAVLEGMCQRWPVGTLRLADRGLREGILHGLLAREAA